MSTVQYAAVVVVVVGGGSTQRNGGIDDVMRSLFILLYRTVLHALTVQRYW